MSNEIKITKTQFLYELNNSKLNDAEKKKATSIFESCAKLTKGGDDTSLDATELKRANEEFNNAKENPQDGTIAKDIQNAGTNVGKFLHDFLNKPDKTASTQTDRSSKENQSTPEQNITTSFFQYISGDKNFTGKLKNNQSMNLPAGCELAKDEKGTIIGIKYNNKTFTMRGKEGDTQDPLRFECDETKQTLKQALSETKSDDATHKYHNHGNLGNDSSSYDATNGVINHGSSETNVSQVQTFASMLMNGAEDSTMQLDEQKQTKGKAKETTGEKILKTINTDNDKGIDMQELISYLNAAQKEASSVQNATGARKFAKGVDLDAKDLANIGKVFKQYDADSNGKLDKDELQKLLDDLKKNSMDKLAKNSADDKYIGKKPDNTKPPEDKPPVKPTPGKGEKLEGNRRRLVDRDSQPGDGVKESYNYNHGKRTLVTPDGYADKNGNIAVRKNPLLGKKKFDYIEGLGENVDARLKERTVDGKEDKKIVKVKDSDNNVKYYTVITNTDGTYKLGEELITKTTRGKDTFVTKAKQREDILLKVFGNESTKKPISSYTIPDNITTEYSDNGTNILFKISGKSCTDIRTIKACIIKNNI